MLLIARKEGFKDVAAFRESLKTNPKYIPTSAEQILDDFRKYIAQMQPKLPELFGYIPGSPVTVEAIPPFQSAPPRTIKPARPTANARDGSASPPPISRIAR